MRRPLLAVLTVVLLGGCDESTSPSDTTKEYSLARIGSLHLPIGLGTNGGPPFLIADTLRLGNSRPREGSPFSSVLAHISVYQDASGVRSRLESQHGYSIQGSTLTYDTCPLGSLCTAALVYAPLTFHIVGDSLFQIVPQASPLPAGAVYGRVQRR